jgi:uncharacterized protein (DUF433 family)
MFPPGSLWRCNALGAAGSSRPRTRGRDHIMKTRRLCAARPRIRGTRIPVELIADMSTQGAGPEEILEGYPALDGEKIDLAPLCVQAFPRRGRPASPPWAKQKPIHATRRARALSGAR